LKFVLEKNKAFGFARKHGWGIKRRQTERKKAFKQIASVVLEKEKKRYFKENLQRKEVFRYQCRKCNNIRLYTKTWKFDKDTYEKVYLKMRHRKLCEITYVFRIEYVLYCIYSVRKRGREEASKLFGPSLSRPYIFFAILSQN
jgi:hypothetical protein